MAFLDGTRVTRDALPPLVPPCAAAGHARRAAWRLGREPGPARRVAAAPRAPPPWGPGRAGRGGGPAGGAGRSGGRGGGERQGPPRGTRAAWPGPPARAWGGGRRRGAGAPP